MTDNTINHSTDNLMVSQTTNPTTSLPHRRASMNDSTLPAALREQATDLRLHGLLEHWAEVMAQPEQGSGEQWNSKPT